MEPVPQILLFTEGTSPRLSYVTRFLGERIGISLTIIPGATPDPSKETAALYYGPNPVAGMVTLFSAGLLFEKGLHDRDIPVLNRDGQVILFPSPESFAMSFDLFSAIFYLLSRYEEYLPFKPDKYGRYEADQSLAWKYGFLEEPVVEQWIELFRQMMVHHFPGIPITRKHFRFLSTIDIDSPWAYLHKGFFHTSGMYIKYFLQLHFRELGIMLRVLLKKEADPYDNYAYLRELEDTRNFRSVYFFLAGNTGHYDVNYALGSRAFQNLIRTMQNDRKIGIHFSFDSNRGKRKLQREYQRYAGTLGNKPDKSRQHYLWLRFPDTFRNISELGIREEYSMGYASHPGFRAGISSEFRFYDLLRESETDLILHPFVFMEVTLQQYLHCTAKEAGERIRKLIDKVRAVNGTFTSLWHNESLSNRGIWKGWRKVFEEMVEQLTTKN